MYVDRTEYGSRVAHDGFLPAEPHEFDEECRRVVDSHAEGSAVPQP